MDDMQTALLLATVITLFFLILMASIELMGEYPEIMEQQLEQPFMI